MTLNMNMVDTDKVNQILYDLITWYDKYENKRWIEASTATILTRLDNLELIDLEGYLTELVINGETPSMKNLVKSINKDPRMKSKLFKDLAMFVKLIQWVDIPM